MDIRQCTATNVIKPKVVKETLQWRSERLAQGQTFKQTELTSELNIQYNAIISRLFNGKSGHTINYPLYDAIHEKNILHIRAIHASPKVPQSPIIIIHNVYALGMQTVLYALET